MNIFSSKHHIPHSGNHELSLRIHNVGHDPHIDWVIILVSSTIIGVALVVIGVVAYQNAERRLSVPPAVTTNSAVPINPQMLQHTLKQFEVKARERQDLIKTYRGPVDPSL